MAKSEEINQSRKRKLLLDDDIYELDPEDRSSVESPTVIGTQPSDEVIVELNTSQESVVFDNPSESVSFDKTVGPGAAPEGFILVDEEICVDDPDNSRNQNDPTSKTSSPIFKVMFRDVDAASKHRQPIKEFLKNLIAKNAKVKTETDSSGLILEVWDQHLNPEEGEILLSTESENSQETLEDQLFTFDTKPKLEDELDIPTYGKKFKKILNKEVAEDVAENQPEDCAPKLSCFNCSENHNLRDCKKPRNHTNINKNRKLFITKVGPRNGRYHLEEEQKFGHFMPGQLSKNLRRALGLRDNELPKHIYSMRILGYPPGWMEEARVQHSGLTLFNSDGSADLDPADEDGEIYVCGEKDEFDVKKIYDFPGFNVDPPHGTRDEYKYHGAPRMQEIHSKEVMLSSLIGRTSQDGYKRKKMKVTRSETVSNSSVIPSEMDVVDVEDGEVEVLAVNGLFVPPLPAETPLKPPEPPVILSEDSNSQSQGSQSPDSTNQNTAAPSSRTNSPSLSDLETAKKELLAELDQPRTPSNPGTPVNSGKASIAPEIDDKTHMPPPPNTELTPQSSRMQSRPETPKASNTGTVKSVDLGTPILQSTSPYSKLPSSEKFSKDICDVMNFENLPDSTGKYEKMSGLIKKVRNVVSRIQQE